MEYFKQAHVTYHCRYHLVFVTKYRRRLFKPGIDRYATTVLTRLTRKFPDVVVVEAETDLDHVHLLVTIPPKYAVAEVVQYLKGASARYIRKRFPFINKVYWGADGIWSDGYFVSTTGINEAIIRRYVQNQGKEDSGQATLDLG